MALLICLSKLSKKLSYIDDLEQFCELLYHTIDEQGIVIEKGQGEDWKRMMLNVYCQIIELSTRNPKIRELMSKKINQQPMLTLDHLFLGYKICLW